MNLLLIAALLQEPAAKPQESEEVKAVTAELQKIKNRIPELQKSQQELKALQTKAQQAATPAEVEKLKKEFEMKYAAFQGQVAEWQKSCGTVADLAKTKCETSPKDEALHRVWLEALFMAERTEETVPVLQKIAELSGKKEDLMNVAIQHLQLNQFQKAFEAAEKLLMIDKEDQKAREVYGQAAFALMNWEAAKKYPSKYKDAVAECETAWKAEAEIRAKEEKAGDNPRVKFTTSRGAITVELFENEAPNTVANFIELIEKKFYDNLKFHRVIPSFMVQGGCPRGNGTGDPGYRFADELKGAYRRHFRGSLSMANSGPDTNGSQFFITHIPTAWLNGKHTVFGRVVEGQEIVEAIKGNDVIQKVEVLRKREHAYGVKKLP